MYFRITTSYHNVFVDTYHVKTLNLSQEFMTFVESFPINESTVALIHQRYAETSTLFRKELYIPKVMIDSIIVLENHVWPKNKYGTMDIGEPYVF